MTQHERTYVNYQKKLVLLCDTCTAKNDLVFRGRRSTLSKNLWFGGTYTWNVVNQSEADVISAPCWCISLFNPWLWVILKMACLKIAKSPRVRVWIKYFLVSQGTSNSNEQIRSELSILGCFGKCSNFRVTIVPETILPCASCHMNDRISSLISIRPSLSVLVRFYI